MNGFVIPLLPVEWESPSKLENGLDREDEYVLRYKGSLMIDKLVSRLGDVNQQYIRSTAHYYFQAFYNHKSLMREDIGVVGLAVVFLACKVTEYPRKMRDVCRAYQAEIQQTYPGLELLDREQYDLRECVARIEAFLLRVVSFNFRPPLCDVIDFLSEPSLHLGQLNSARSMRTDSDTMSLYDTWIDIWKQVGLALCRLMPQDLAEATVKELHQMAKSFLFDSFRGLSPHKFSSYMLANGCFYIAFCYHKEKAWKDKNVGPWSELFPTLPAEAKLQEVRREFILVFRVRQKIGKNPKVAFSLPDQSTRDMSIWPRKRPLGSPVASSPVAPQAPSQPIAGTDSSSASARVAKVYSRDCLPQNSRTSPRRSPERQNARVSSPVERRSEHKVSVGQSASSSTDTIHLSFGSDAQVPSSNSGRKHKIARVCAREPGDVSHGAGVTPPPQLRTPPTRHPLPSSDQGYREVAAGQYEAYGGGSAPRNEAGGGSAPRNEAYGGGSAPRNEAYGGGSAPRNEAYGGGSAPRSEAYGSGSAPRNEAYGGGSAPRNEAYGGGSAPRNEAYGSGSAPRRSNNTYGGGSGSRNDAYGGGSAPRRSNDAYGGSAPRSNDDPYGGSAPRRSNDVYGGGAGRRKSSDAYGCGSAQRNSTDVYGCGSAPRSNDAYGGGSAPRNDACGGSAPRNDAYGVGSAPRTSPTYDEAKAAAFEQAVE